MKEKRKLATVLFADIEGYTSLMQTDEKQAMLYLAHFKELIDQIVPLHEGEIIQYYGDAVLLTYESGQDGVECGMALQKAFIEKKIPVRIGMHLGDVLFKSNNVFGDGVNIASRIESMGTAGSILISKAIRNQLSNKSEFLVSSLGSFNFKNVQEPMEVFALANEGLVVPTRKEVKTKGKLAKQKRPGWQPIVVIVLLLTSILMTGYYFLSGNSPGNATDDDMEIKNSIAVFPFDVKGSPDIAYLGEGIVDLISTQLDEIPKLNSIDPNRIFSQLGNERNISRKPEKAAELATDYGATKFILGSIVQVGEKLQFSATKYDASGKEINRQSVSADNMETLSTTINNLIKEIVADELKEANYELASLGALTSNNLESLKLYLEGEQAYRNVDYRKARDLFEQATELDSTFGLAWMRLYNADSWIGWNSNEHTLQKWTEYKHTMPDKWQLYHEAAVLHRQPNPKAIAIYQKLIRLYGDTPAFHYGLGEFYFHLNEAYGRPATEAKPYFLETIELDPGNQEALWHLGNIAVYENDRQALQKALSLANDRRKPSLLALELIVKDTITDAEIEQVLSLNPSSAFFPTLYFAAEEKPFHNELLERFVETGLSEYGNLLANSSILCTSGKEKEAYGAWLALAKIGFNFGEFNMEQLVRSAPAFAMVTEEFLPFREHYESLYQETKDRDTPLETFAAIKYAMALNKENEVVRLKKKLQDLATSPETIQMATYFDYSLRAFEAKMAGENEKALAYIDSVYNTPIGFWETQSAYLDKSMLAAHIYAEQGDYLKAINYYNHSFVMVLGDALIYGYRNYKLSQWYEAIGDVDNALKRCNIFLESYKNCDEKYRPWVEEVTARKERLMARMQ